MNEINEIKLVNIDKLVGRELDRLVHLCVFQGEYESEEIPYYSTNIIDTMLVLEWLMERGDMFLEWWSDDEWFVCNKDLHTRHKYPKLGWSAVSNKSEKPSLPLVICRAALKEYNMTKSILIGDKNNTGILIEYVKSRNEIRIGGWYDCGYAAISTEHFSVDEFCERLGIDRNSKIKVKVARNIDEKPICNEICADPDLVEVMDSTKETERAKQRELARIANCSLKTKYKCIWEK